MVVSVVVSIVFSGVETNNFWVQSMTFIVMYLGYFLVFIAFRKTVKRHDYCFKLQPSNTLLTILLSFTCIAGFMLVQFAAIDLFRLMGQARATEPFRISGWGMFLMCVLVMAILPAIIEELLFRGVILKSLSQHGTVSAVLLSSLFFAMFHLSFTQLVYQFILGLVFALVYLRTKNLLYPILLHFVNNFFIVTYTFIAGSDYMPYAWNTYTIVTGILLCIVGAAAIIGLVSVLKKEDNARRQQTEG